MALQFKEVKMCKVEWNDESESRNEDVDRKKVNIFVTSLICCGCTNIYVDGISYTDWDEFRNSVIIAESI